MIWIFSYLLSVHPKLNKNNDFAIQLLELGNAVGFTSYFKISMASNLFWILGYCRYDYKEKHFIFHDMYGISIALFPLKIIKTIKQYVPRHYQSVSKMQGNKHDKKKRENSVKFL